MKMLPSITFGPTEIEAIPPKPLGSSSGIGNRQLWTDGTSLTGVLRVDGGQRLGEHTHRRHDHHLWVIAGEADILGERLGAGSYVFVPAGLEHDIDTTGTDGCTVFYSYWLRSLDA